jgi:hypothetical protein
MNGTKTRSGRYPENVPNVGSLFAYFRSAIKNNELNFFARPWEQLIDMTLADIRKND